MPDKKERIDKYYKLAKEKGYRARSAFKLKELDRKYHFLNTSRVAIDLCAAPGGWLQILAQEMPLRSKIVGVDLEPIRSMNDCHTFVSDITSLECRRKLSVLLENHKADVVVHDGAPNFGTSSGEEYFVQNDLVLHAYKLACEFLVKNGTFVTKIFRSENFTIIVSLLEKYFDQVYVTKPLSSRNISAEIYAVCKGYKDPDELDFNVFEAKAHFKNCDVGINDCMYQTVNLSDFICDKTNKMLKTSGSFRVDFSSERIDEECRDLMADLRLVDKIGEKRLIKMKKRILKDIKNKTLEDSVLTSKLGSTRSTKSTKAVKETLLMKLEKKIPAIVEKERQKVKENIDEKNLQEVHHFFDDKLFDTQKLKTVKEYVHSEEDEEVEVSSCSSDMEIGEDELKYALMLKMNPEEFEENAVDKYIIDSDDIQLPGEVRPVKINTPKLEKKRQEVLSRKKARAIRRAGNVMKDIRVENEKEEALIYKKVFKGAYKKQSYKNRLVFANVKGGKKYLPKGKGKVLRLDRRMKNDLYLQKRRKLKK